MTERTKYDGKLTDALIQTVVEAENRLRGLETSRSVEMESFPSGGQDEPISQPRAKPTDCGAAFDQSQHARSIEHSREVSAGCWDTPTDGDE